MQTKFDIGDKVYYKGFKCTIYEIHIFSDRTILYALSIPYAAYLRFSDCVVKEDDLFVIKEEELSK